jgi:hypothetical protein
MSPHFLENMGRERTEWVKRGGVSPVYTQQPLSVVWSLTIGNIGEIRHEKTATKGGISPGRISPRW